jgi:hypothetical protein
MKELFEVPDYSDLKREIEALRKRIEDLESGGIHPRGAGRATCWRGLAQRLALGLPAVIVCVLLALGVLGATSKQDPLFIDQNGYVGINQSEPNSPLDVNGNALFRGSITFFPEQLGDKISLYGQTGSAHYGFGIQGSLLQIHTIGSTDDIAFGYGKSDSFTETMRIKGNGLLSLRNGLFLNDRADGTASIVKNAYVENGKWQVKDANKKAFTLEIRDSGVLDLYGTQTNGNTDWRQMASFDAANNKIAFPSGAPVEVKGEIRGKPWTSQEYEWKQDPWEGTSRRFSTRMTKSDRSVCFLTFVSGSFQGTGEGVQIIQESGYWALSGFSQQKHVWAKAKCIGAPE